MRRTPTTRRVWFCSRGSTRRSLLPRRSEGQGTESLVALFAKRARNKVDPGGKKFRISCVNLKGKECELPTPRAWSGHSVLGRACSSLDCMKHLTFIVFFGVALLWGLFASGCSARRVHSICSDGTHCTSRRPIPLAQAATMDCRPGDSTLTCCIKKHPNDPVGACGATPSEVEQVSGLRALMLTMTTTPTTLHCHSGSRTAFATTTGARIVDGRANATTACACVRGSMNGPKTCANPVNEARNRVRRNQLGPCSGFGSEGRT